MEAAENTIYVPVQMNILGGKNLKLKKDTAYVYQVRQSMQITFKIEIGALELYSNQESNLMTFIFPRKFKDFYYNIIFLEIFLNGPSQSCVLFINLEEIYLSFENPQ